MCMPFVVTDSRSISDVVETFFETETRLLAFETEPRLENLETETFKFRVRAENFYWKETERAFLRKYREYRN